LRSPPLTYIIRSTHLACFPPAIVKVKKNPGVMRQVIRAIHARWRQFGERLLEATYVRLGSERKVDRKARTKARPRSQGQGQVQGSRGVPWMTGFCDLYVN